ncbi:hypothetical protein CASFOL_009392 [Castilleja foliolosa]|uniref:Uncharacterized protein n=1 Tax=Castilleja foliolosa TaxID=1961234 RepID=A0ABD3DXJ8_9LAMI
MFCGERNNEPYHSFEDEPYHSFFEDEPLHYHLHQPKFSCGFRSHFSPDFGLQTTSHATGKTSTANVKAGSRDSKGRLCEARKYTSPKLEILAGFFVFLFEFLPLITKTVGNSYEELRTLLPSGQIGDC